MRYVQKCPGCGHTGTTSSFVHDANPPIDNSGIWCPVCDLSLEFDNLGHRLQHYVFLDEFTAQKIKQFLVMN